MSRYLVLGPTGSGKSTLARAISERSGAPYFDTDALYWKSDRTRFSDADVVGLLPLTDRSWVLDGNFVDFRRQVWDAADVIIWLAYPFALVLLRLIERNFGSWLLRRPLWTGRPMPLRVAISGVRHLPTQYQRQHAHFPSMLREQKGQKVIVLRHTSERADWIQAIPGSSATRSESQ